MVVPAFLDERRQHLRHGRILHCCTTKNPNYNIHCPSSHSSTQLRPITPVAPPVTVYLTLVPLCVKAGRVRDQMAVASMATTKTRHGVLTQCEAAVLW